MIQVLSKDLANKIAAGEVVERPASVVKELVENAIDAKSKRIFVSLLEGGVRLIQVTDDGEGMTRDEARLAFERHATSKISKASDLASIMTLGFRGEALPSIASISKMRLTTKAGKGAEEGTEIDFEGGAQKSIKQVAAPQGSTFEVRDLFFNVPARRKFLKSEQTELSHIRRLLFHLALSHAKIHFRLRHGGKTLLDAPPSPSFKERAEQLLGTRMAADAMTFSGDSPIQKGLSLAAFLARPPLRRNFKREQYLFVNHRPIKSPLLTHAVYDAYGSYLMKGEEPFFVLFITIDPSEVDVNVHPAKREVRFRNTNQIHQAIRNVIRDALSKAGEAISEDPKVPLLVNRGERDLQPSPHLPEGKTRWPGWPDSPVSSDGLARESNELSRSPNRGDFIRFASESMPTPSHQDLFDQGKYPLIRPIGQVYGTFLLAEIDGVLAMVDQHTAHERILYEQFLEAWQRLEACPKEGLEIQPLLIPQQIDLSMQQGGVLKEHLKALELIGCKIEPFGETAFLVREAPALISRMNFELFLSELADELGELGVSSKIDQPIQTIMASMACHGAVRAHQAMSLPEIESLLKKYFERKTPPTCPHGRPIVMRYPLQDLEKLFRRK